MTTTTTIQPPQKHPSGEMKTRLIGWAITPFIDKELLLQWLNGQSLPSGEERPYLFLSRALPERGDLRRESLCSSIAQHIAPLITDLSKGELWVSSKNSLIELLHFTANLNSPRDLAAPLEGLLLAVITREPRPPFFDDKMVRESLLSAVIGNQIDRRYETLWISYLEGEKDYNFGGDRFTGFTGLSQMPTSELTIGQPNIPALVQGIKLLQPYLELEHPTDKVRHLAPLIRSACEHFPKAQIRGELALAQAELPLWVRECLSEAA